ncbi:hypothetical protein KKF91_20345 [Myxococcota bacterium]|nr:hypothetical protein [Myxococcota bacterium]MBU1432897.1 hypothetical protein [Myxococcota bacterium]MBU1900141.1 hypothetical protein [Myxococcota bacterium]
MRQRLARATGGACLAYAFALLLCAPRATPLLLAPATALWLVRCAAARPHPVLDLLALPLLIALCAEGAPWAILAVALGLALHAPPTPRGVTWRALAPPPLDAAPPRPAPPWRATAWVGGLLAACGALVWVWPGLAPLGPQGQLLRALIAGFLGLSLSDALRRRLYAPPPPKRRARPWRALLFALNAALLLATLTLAP